MKLKFQMLDMDLKDLVFVLLDFGVALVQFFKCSPSLGKVMYIYTIKYVLESYKLSVDFYRGLQFRDCLVSQMRLWTFK